MDSIEFNQMYRMYVQRLTYIAYSIIKDRCIAEDVVQETFLKAYKKIDSIGDIGKIGAWLSTITTRTAIDFLRAEKRRNWVLTDFAFIDHSQFLFGAEWVTENEVEINLLKEELNESIHQLSNEYQEVLVLRIHYGLKEVEIADLLQLKSATVKTRLYRARKKIKQAIAEKYPA